MNSIRRVWLLAVFFCIAAGSAAAQTDPRAQMISPFPGSTLPGKTVTLTWSPGVGGNDYFLQVTQVPLVGREIFYAPLTVESVTLVNIPTNGLPVYVYLSTKFKGEWAEPLSYTYTAANAVPTTMTVDDTTVGSSNATQNVTLTSSVAGGIINQGTVTFQVVDGAVNVGAAVTSATLTSGSASASYALPGGTAAKRYTIRADYSGGANFHPSSGSGTLTVSATPPADFKGFVPIVLDVTGLGSAHYTSELQLTNLGASSATVVLSYTGAIGSGSGIVMEDVPAGQQVVYPDVISHLRSRGVPIPVPGSQGGTLVVSAAAAGVRATVRTGADTAASQPSGRAGLAYTDSDPAASSAAAKQYVCGLRTNDADRSKVAVYNMGPDPVSLEVTLVSGDDGSAFDVTAGRPISLSAYGWFQYEDANLLRMAGFPSGYAIVERATGSGPFGAYGVVNDQLTNDGSFIPALPGTFIGSRLTVPVLVETGAFESELILTNRGSATATFTLRYVESLSPAAGPGGAMAVDVAAGRQRIIPNAIDFLRSNGVAIGARGGASYAGSLRIHVSGVGLEDAFAGARTSSLSPAGGEFGLFYPAVGSSQEFSDSALVLGLKADANNRSNVAAIHTGAEGTGPITLEFQALDGSNGGTAVGQPLSLTLNPGGWVQPPGFFASGGVPNGYVRIRRTAGAAPWYAYGVINDGGQPGQRTGDGSYVPGVQQ